MFVAYATAATLLGIAALITAVAGVVTSIFGAIKSHREGKEKADVELRERLRECREEAENLAVELHRTKMSHFESEG